MAEAPADLSAEIRTLEQKHAENPEGRYFVPLANAYRKAGDLSRAEFLLREGLGRYPQYLSAHIVLGRCLADRGATREAAGEFRHVLGIDPQNLIALRTLGELAMSEGHQDEAGQWYRELLAVDPMNEAARSVLHSLDTFVAAPEPFADAAEESFDAASWWEVPSALADEPGGEIGTAGSEEATDEVGLAWVAPGAGEAADAPIGEAAEPDGEPRGLETVAEHGSEPDFGAVAEAYAKPDPEPDEVVTETLADLYTRQGFYDRAADVYRELLRRRGDDPALLRRLAELEALTAGEAALPTAEGLPSTANEQEQGEAEWSDASASETLPWASEEDAFANSFASGFADEPGSGEATPTPEADPERADTPPAEPHDPVPLPRSAAEIAPESVSAAEPTTLGEYLSGLLAWIPASSPGAGTPREPVETENPPATEEFSQRVGVPRPDEVAAMGEMAMPGPDPRPAASDEPFPWELPLPPAGENADSREREADAAFSFDSFFSDTEPTPAAPPASGVPNPEPMARGNDALASEDEDLESFQAWLRSLRR